MDKFIPLSELYKEKSCKDEFIPKYGFSLLENNIIIERDKIIMPKRKLKEEVMLNGIQP